ncbi:hypothetical protein N789_07835 [Arenimonas oryziterrae DSM 21050 = YC6267]|uniref:DUF2271 domain-containing protein n=1 Tax=Arenimonas oryziterrae DSM 21050 = YC6267 TaxID=1121015 RepID=A0A091AUD0_9GAMM|nr:hypothetical protein N789_07835 [Arenimonas oryziterrae DSM 21050 = YC6267]
MKRLMIRSLLLSAALSASAASAAELSVSVQVPALKVAEYHKPYVAIWVEKSDQSVAANLAIWYQTRDGKEPGTKWLPELRQWWRRSGRDLSLPVDGVSGATRSAGVQTLRFDDRKGVLAKLPPGDYTLVVEAVREVGGRELLKIPFTWPAKMPVQTAVQGEHELGTITLDLKP